MPYAEALATFLSVWIGRLKGLLLDPAITVFSHLTGGRDTRAVLALFLAVARQLGDGAPRVRYQSAVGSHDDLSVAKALSCHFDLSLNEWVSVERVQLDAKESYEAWRELLYASSNAYQGSAEDNQILFDVMQNLAPGLAGYHTTTTPSCLRSSIGPDTW